MKENSLSLLLLIIGNGLLVHHYKIKCIEKIAYLETFRELIRILINTILNNSWSNNYPLKR